MSCIKRIAMLEPLVDVVDQEQLVTDSCIIKDCEIESMSKSDATFQAPFRIQALRDDYIHALVAYFDISFSQCHKVMGFSTGPQYRATHWKQTVFYLEDTITICTGEVLEGTISVVPNKKNPRDLNIVLYYKFQGNRCSVERTQEYRMR